MPRTVTLLATAASATLLCVLAVPTAASAAAGPRTAECAADTGPYQTAAERHLGLAPDGQQSPADCAAIRALQTRNGYEQADGYAGIETWRIIQYEQALADPAGLDGCTDEAELVVCVDLDRQLLWVRDGWKIAFGPVPVRTGTSEYPTRTGYHRIYERVIDQWSELYEGPMPFSQFFDGGQALHASYRPIWEEPGSHGCVNLRHQDAQRLWQALRVDDLVHIWGSRD